MVLTEELDFIVLHHDRLMALNTQHSYNNYVDLGVKAHEIYIMLGQIHPKMDESKRIKTTFYRLENYVRTYKEKD